MKCLHVHVAVSDLDHSIAFYAILFGAAPSVVKPDYAKWQLGDPRVNFAISTRGGGAGLDHLGLEVDDRDELDAVSRRLAAAGQAVVEQNGATCCYARSDKAWVHDPQGIPWETFVTFGATTVYGEDRAATSQGPAGPTAAARACCTGTAPTIADGTGGAAGTDAARAAPACCATD